MILDHISKIQFGRYDMNVKWILLHPQTWPSPLVQEKGKTPSSVNKEPGLSRVGHTFFGSVPVPHKAVAEVSRIGHYRRGELL